MTLYNKIYQYLNESWISFKEEDTDQNTDNAQTQDQDQTQDKDQTQDQDQNQNVDADHSKDAPSLDWKFLSNSLILYNGDKSNPNAMVWIFANQLNIGYKEKWLETFRKDKDKDKDKDKKDPKYNADKFKKDLKKLATVAVLGGVVSQGLDATTNYFTAEDDNKKSEKKNKNKNGEEDKLASLFDKLDTFDLTKFKESDFEETLKKYMRYVAIPDDLIDQYITAVKQKLLKKEKEDAKAASAIKRKTKQQTKQQK